MVCMAWTISDEESHDREQAEEWLKREDPGAFILRDEVMREHGRPGTAVRIEATTLWAIFGVIAALTFTILGLSKLAYSISSPHDSRYPPRMEELGGDSPLTHFHLADCAQSDCDSAIHLHTPSRLLWKTHCSLSKKPTTRPTPDPHH